MLLSLGALEKLIAHLAQPAVMLHQDKEPVIQFLITLSQLQSIQTYD